MQTKQPTLVFDPVTGDFHFVGNFETTTCWANGAKEVTAAHRGVAQVWGTGRSNVRGGDLSVSRRRHPSAATRISPSR